MLTSEIYQRILSWIFVVSKKNMNHLCSLYVHFKLRVTSILPLLPSTPSRLKIWNMNSWIVLLLFSDATMTCKVNRCSEKGKSYYCRLCGCKNSKHFSQDCPKGRRLYHGTRLPIIKGISSEGLQPSTTGHLGQVYILLRVSMLLKQFLVIEALEKVELYLSITSI